MAISSILSSTPVIVARKQHGTRSLLENDRKSRPAVQQTMQHWLDNKDFAGVRGDALAKLPEAERKDWQKLWEDVEALRQRAARSK